MCSPGHYIIGPFAAAAELGLVSEGDVSTGMTWRRCLLLWLRLCLSGRRQACQRCRTSTRHGLDCLPRDTDGHFIKLPPSLAAAAVSELTGKLEALRA